MPKIPVKGTELTALVDADVVKQIPRSIWVDYARKKPKPLCRYDGVIMTLARAVGLINGLNPNCYLLPANGDPFDCRKRNIKEYDTIPNSCIPTYKNNKAGIKGIRTRKDGLYTVIIRVGNKDRTFGSTRDLTIAQAILNQARKLV